MPQKRIYTLGYQMRSQEEFVRTLGEAGVRVLVDVRQTAWSNRREYGKGKLSEALEQAGIRYVHAAFVGNPKELRRSAGTHAECLEMYAAHVRCRPAILQRFDELLEQLHGEVGPVCLMCYERHPADCHRAVLLDCWQEFTGEEAEIHHLGPEGAPRFLEHPTK